MRFPQVSERVKEAPAHALRAVFASIGQVLVATDRMKNKPAEKEQPASPRAGEPAATTAAPAAKPAAAAADTATAAPAAKPAAEAPAPAPATKAGASAPVPGDAGAKTGKTAARTPAAKPPAAKPPAAKAPAAEAPAKPPAAKRSTQTGNVRLLPDAGPAPAAEEAAAAKKPAVTESAPAATTPAQATPPIANYEQLTVASLRARLRGLTVVQVRELIGYERAHADRPDIIAMFERRVTKLETPEG